MKRKELTAEEVISRARSYSKDDAAKLCKYLEMSSSSSSKKIELELRNMGSNDIANLFRDEPVKYDEVVFDVGKKVGAKVKESNTAEKNELLILEKMFADALDRMSEEEKRTLFSTMNIKDMRDIPWASGSLMIARTLVLLGDSFILYQMAVVVANIVARAILGEGLSFAANAAITRTLGVMLGPVGWIASGAWLIIDLAGPAYRKTVPAIIHMAFLRQLVKNRVSIGVVGDGSTGKDSLMKAVFEIDTGNIDPIAGSTKHVSAYIVSGSQNASVLNFPGFNDFRDEVNELISDRIRSPDLFLLVIDVTRGTSKTDIEIYKKIVGLGFPVLVCANKMDLIKDADKEKVKNNVRERLNTNSIIFTVFDPLYSDKNSIEGVDSIREWITEHLSKFEKVIDWESVQRAS